ncbi:hypothetical protein Poli38472_000239 [Pythium oligandrum]|uniref:Calx-beta domain-containing protein n=1 Tax=Pythium oligandrum TaxID=41045 RepID=A0A8K1FHX0_PYTOL|nr:hypothetical protein Poli38472_000239 [Pythium oligandrum]|eukprot:TMW60197.1 hypothetical protein Poli38472_000239 [Pythium oligandrum]
MFTSIRSYAVDAKQLIVLVQPITSVAGEPFALQPVVALTDDDGNILTTENMGTVRAQIGVNPARFASVQPATNSFPIENGIAKCAGLYINLVSSGYTIMFVSLYHGVRAETAPFDIITGSRYKLAIMADISTAFGGTAFRPQPAVGVVDRGGNLVESLNEGTVRLEILKNPVGGTLLPARNLNVSIGGGMGTFQGLYIDVAGSPYYLRYTTDLVLEGGSIVDTNPFTVAEGLCNNLVLAKTPKEATGGKAFSIQPVAKLIDAGGNLLEADSSSIVRVAIASNPSGGTLSPSSLLKARVEKGIAIFRGLRIDKAGEDYTLTFTLFTKIAGRNDWLETSIEKLSPSFNVTVGMPVELFLKQNLSDGVLDGQPNEVQPILALRDSGGNVVSSLVTGTVAASMVPSAGIASSIVVDTSSAPMLIVLEVRALPTPGYLTPYGVGMRIYVQVTFSDEVIVTGLPILTLVSSSTGGPNGVAECVTINTWTDKLLFQYYTTATDAATDMDYVSTSALSLNGGSILDRNGRTPVLTLPAVGSANSLAGTSDVSIDTTPPVIVSVSCTDPGDGEFGFGEEIYLKVLYSTPVTVYGAPVLPVALNVIGNGAARRDANFSSGNNTDTLVFLYVVQSGDATAVGVPLDVTSTIILAAGMYIKRYSTRPTTDVVTTMATVPKNLASMNAMTIDTAIPIVDPSIGVTSTAINGVYMPGDVIDIVVTFTKAVKVDGFPRVYMESGSIKRPAGYKSGSGTTRLVFSYTVAAYDSHSATGNTFLNYRDGTALDLNSGSIRRYTARGTQAAGADVSLAATTLNLKSLKDNAQILLDGQQAKVLALSIVSTPSNTVSRGDVVRISISYSSQVTVDTSNGKPSLALGVGDNNRQAIYVSGSGSQALAFDYTVQLGDHAALGMDYRTTTSLALNGARILKMSANPTMDADLTLPEPTLSLANPVVVVDPLAGFQPTVESLTVDVPVGEYGSNQVMSFTVKFSDEVVVDGQPMLKVNTNFLVPYVTGTATRSLVFMYIVRDGDATTDLNKFNDDAIVCDPPACSIMNYNGELAVLSLATTDLQPRGIVIDTHPPVVVDVYAITPAATVNGGSFVVGDVIQIIVEMSLDVFIDPPTTAYPEKAPLLILNTHPFGRQVLCVGFFNEDHKKMLFEYTVEDGDVADDLKYLDTDSLTLNNGQCAIKRFSTTPTTDAILTLPTPYPLGQAQNQVLNVNTLKIPTVLGVTASTPDGTYRCGDRIEIVVSFSQHVVVEGKPFMWLDLGVNARKAMYTSGSGTMTLKFVYTIEENDYSVDLEYIDHHSLDASAAEDSILHYSTKPTTLANLDLPYPYTQNSLSFNKNFLINGRKPTITEVKFLSADGVYAVNDKVVIEMTFSSCVSVVPAPTTGAMPQMKFQPIPPGSTVLITRYARYVSGSPGNKLRFEYTVKTGDTSKKLDYADAQSMVWNGAKILTCTTSIVANPPVQLVETHLNPPGGRLLGATSKPIIFGSVAFTDLLVDHLGFNYEVKYRTDVGLATLEAANYFDVLYSAAYGLRSTPYASGDRLGSSVDVDGDTLVMGAPGAKEPIPAVQIVSVIGDSKDYVDEIQVLETIATQRPAIQEITTSAAPGETVGGWFFLKMGSIGPTRRLYYNFDEAQLRVALELDLGFGLETIRVTRRENTYCGCDNAYVWTVTFMYVEGTLPTLTTTSMLTGRLASVGDGRGANQARILVESTAISGFFTLQLGSLVTRNVKYNAAEDELSTILSQDLKLPVRRVMRSLPTPVGGYTWSITFAASDQIYDVPDLVPQNVGLGGFQARCLARTARDGLGRVSGAFRLRFRNDLFPNDETDDIPVSASDLQVEQALEKLVSINDVRVVRSSSMNVYGGYAWTVTFIQVNTRSDYGPVADTSGNLPAMVARTTATINNKIVQLLKGTNARVSIQFGGYSLPPLTDGMTHWGLPGTNAGQAAIFIRAENDWKQQGGTLVGGDTRAEDRFGASVSIKGNQVLVGAPAAAIFGDFEIQNLLCDADGGYFKVVYRGQASDPIPFNADKETLRLAVVTIMNVGFTDVEISTTFPTVCRAGNPIEISIVLRSGDHGDRTGNILDLQVDGSHLTKTNGVGSVAVAEYRAGTYRSDGVDAKGIQIGAAYLFKRDPVTTTWSQQLKFTPPSSTIFDMREFGYAVAIFDTFAVIGAPGAYDNQGRVYVYQFNAITATWSLFQVLSAAPYDITSGDRFGESVAISGNPLATVTIVIGAPGYATASGAVFVYDVFNGKFQNRQFILQITPELKIGDRFGCAVDLDMATTYTLVVGANRNAYKNGRDTGIALVFVRRSATDTFFNLQQVLFGSDSRTGDRFGSSVAISRHTLLVGAHEDYKGAKTTRKSVQAVTTTVVGSSSAKLTGGTFVLSLKLADDIPNVINGTVISTLTKIKSRAIAYNVDAASLRAQLEKDFSFFGKILVTRDGPSATTSGYTWYITFAGATSDVPLLVSDSRNLVVTGGPGGRALTSVRWVVRSAPVLRGNTYAFTRTSAGKWIEQASLYPREKQYSSWFGSSVAIDQRTAIVGAPNLDTYESGINSGGGFVYDLGFLAVGFSAKSYTVVEGNDLDVTVQRCSRNNGFCAMDTSGSPRQFINYDTGDAFSDLRSENFVYTPPHIGPYRKLAQLEAVPSDPNAFFAPFTAGQEPYPLTPRGRWLVFDQIGTANSRNQFYGSSDPRSLWIDAKFDYAGVSDYTTATGEMFFDVDIVFQTFRVSTTSDFVVEDPDETVPLRLSLPGVWPSYEGNLWATLTIKDNGDGGSGTRSYLDFLTAGQASRFHQSDSKFGAAVSVYSDGNVAVIGAPMEKQVLPNRDAPVQCGAVYFYVRRSGFWEFDAKIIPGECENGLQYGMSVSIDGILGTIRAIVGAPGAAAAYIYRRQGTTWLQEVRLSDPSGAVTSPTHAFGGQRAVGISGDVAVVGAAGAERIFIYHRTMAGWEFITTMFCSDRVVTQILQQSMSQTYRFGHSVAVYRRTIAVGAPYADAGAFTAAQYHDRSFDRKYFGKGAAYIFHLQAQEQTISLRTDDPLTAGTFQLTTTTRGVTGTTVTLSYGATALGMKAALQELSTIRLVEVTRKGSIEQGYTWSVTFIGDILSVPVLTAQWKDHGCADCDTFSSSFKADPDNQIVVSEVTPIGIWREQTRLTAPDGNPGDQFGSSIAISGEQVIVGAEGSGALITTTWDFETGDLTGWLTTGTAFDNQPTYGDNSYARINSYKIRLPNMEAPGQRALHEGRYWVGTFESRRGASKVVAQVSACAFASDALCNLPDYKLPGPEAAGTFQGDGPQGTMTSQAFTVRGPWLSFRLGGGCDIRLIYVELLIDGRSALRATGKCTESMEVVHWDLKPYVNKSAQIRVVDASSNDLWGHINFDDVQFSWDVAQATTPRAGVAYAFRRKAPTSQDPCIGINRWQCNWEFQARLIASDKRTEDFFGYDVAIDDSTGVAVITAPGQPALDANNSLILDEHELYLLEGVGSVYVFKRADEVRDGKGVLLSPPKWAPKETAKLQFPKKQARAQFGFSVALDRTTLFVGAPLLSTTLLKPKAGQVFAYDAGFATVRFTTSVFACVEGNPDGVVSLTIARATTDLTQPLTIGYATEDVNAYAIDQLKYAACLKIPITQRRDCFDYVQTAGEITFAAGEMSKQIIIPILDDTCYEAKEESFIVRLNVPGGEALIGEQYVAQVRIDDDDFAYSDDPC